MAKHPDPGRVKTRLAVVLGDEAACALYRAMLLDLAERLAALPYAVTWAYAPATAPFAALMPGARCVPQADGDLGARMAHAIAAAFAEGPDPVLVLGADVPHVPAASLADGAAALRAETDLVLGPADDGGYYLIGLTRSMPEVFADIAWGGSRVLEATLERARCLGLRTHLVGRTFDVDEVADLERLRALLARRTAVLPRTARLLDVPVPS